MNLKETIKHLWLTNKPLVIGIGTAGVIAVAGITGVSLTLANSHKAVNEVSSTQTQSQTATKGNTLSEGNTQSTKGGEAENGTQVVLESGSAEGNTQSTELTAEAQDNGNSGVAESNDTREASNDTDNSSDEGRDTGSSTNNDSSSNEVSDNDTSTDNSSNNDSPDVNENTPTESVSETEQEVEEMTVLWVNLCSDCTDKITNCVKQLAAGTMSESEAENIVSSVVCNDEHNAWTEYIKSDGDTRTIFAPTRVGVCKASVNTIDGGGEGVGWLGSRVFNGADYNGIERVFTWEEITGEGDYYRVAQLNYVACPVN